MYNKIKLNHANLNKELTLIADTICGYHWSDNSKATHIYCIGQVIFPAKETPEEIDKLLNNLRQGAATQGENS